jgi:hypothetical protein
MGRPQELFEDLRARGEAAIDDLYAAGASEELYLDFKRSADEGRGNRLALNDRANLAKAISGFGNTAGGVIVWGVDCRPDGSGADVVGQRFPIQQAHRYKSWLEGSVSGATIPSHPGVIHAVLSQRQDESGFVATLIPAADNPPLQTPSDFRYLMRAGSNFTPIPHPLLASMFGRRAAPALEMDFIAKPADLSKFGLTPVISPGWEVRVSNRSLVAARELFVVWTARSNPSNGGLRQAMHGFTEGRLRPVGQAPQIPQVGCIEMVEGERLSPGTSIRVLDLLMDLAEPVNRGLILDVTVGCRGTPPVTRTLTQDAETIGSVLANVKSDLQHRVDPNQFGLAIAKTCFGLR